MPQPDLPKEKQTGLFGRIKRTVRSAQLGGDPDLTARERFRKSVEDLGKITRRVNATPSGVNKARLRGVMMRIRRQRDALREEVEAEAQEMIRGIMKVRHR